MVCVRDFPHGEVSMKVDVMKFGLNLHGASSSIGLVPRIICKQSRALLCSDQDHSLLP